MSSTAAALAFWLILASGFVVVSIVRFRRGRHRLASIGPDTSEDLGGAALSADLLLRQLLREIVAAMLGSIGIVLLAGWIWPDVAPPAWFKDAFFPALCVLLAALNFLSAGTGNATRPPGARGAGFMFLALGLIWIAQAVPFGWIAILLIPATAAVATVRPQLFTGLPARDVLPDSEADYPNFTARVVSVIVLVFSLLVALVPWSIR